MRGRDVDAVRLRARSGSVNQPEPPQELLLEPPQEHLLEPPSQLVLRESTPRAISLTSDSSSARSQGRRLMDEHEKHAEGFDDGPREELRRGPRPQQREKLVEAVARRKVGGDEAAGDVDGKGEEPAERRAQAASQATREGS